MRISRRVAALALAAVGMSVLALAGGTASAGGFEAGFAAKAITPVGPSPAGWDFWVNPATGIWSEQFVDVNADGCWSHGEPFVDDPRNTLIDPQSQGKWDGIWTNAGFGGRCAKGKYDDTWARAVVFREGGKTVAMVSLDVVGFFNEEIRRAKAELAAVRPDIALDGYVVSSTHTHEGPDTMGLWSSPGYVGDGKFPLYQKYIRAQMNAAIAEAYDALEPAAIKFAHTTHTLGIRDSRDPEVIDPNLWSAQAVALDDDAVLGTIVNWSNHPEALASGNPYISSDFPHATREELERLYGGVAVYFSGNVGGLMTPLRVDIPGFGTAPTYARMVEIGRQVAVAAAASLDSASFVADPSIAVRHKEFAIPIDNAALTALNAQGTFDKEAFVAGQSVGPAGNEVKTEMYAVTVGPALFLTVPGEMFPEIVLGGYGRTDGCEAADTGRPYEPVITQQYDTASYHFVLGLGQDELGYIVPGYDFWILGAPPYGTADTPATNDARPFVGVGGEQAADPCGERHYEETVSASSVLAPMVACTAAELAGKDPWNDLAAYPACSEENTTVGPLGTHPDALLD